MNVYLSCAVFVALLCFGDAKQDRSPPKVQLYSRDPAQFGSPNTLICHVSNFHPPDISIQLLCNDKRLPTAVQTDLAFRMNWQFHLTHSAPFNPQDGDKCLCKIHHGDRTVDYMWEPNM